MSHAPLTELSEEEALFRSETLAFARQRIQPLVRSMDETASIDPGLLQGLFEMGLMGIEVPERLGGSSSSFFSAILAIEALAQVDASISVLVDVQNTLVENALLRWGSEAQTTRYLPRLCSEWVGSYALSEASSGSDAFALKARATKSGSGYELEGEKLWITNAAESQLFIVFANADPSQGYRGITAFLIERDTPGFHVGKKEDKLGIRASSTCQLILDGCVLSENHVLGSVGKGYKVAIETLNEGRIGIGAQMLGIAQGAFECAMAHLEEREQFGRKLAEFQGVQFQFARMATEIEAARLLVYNAARLKDAGRPFVKQAAMAKLAASEAAERSASLAIEFLGGIGFTREHPVEKYYRDAKIGKIYEGTSNMQLVTIAKQLRQEV